MRPFEYHAPQSLDEAIALLSARGEAARPLGGGTDIVVQMKEGRTKFAYPQAIVSLNRVPELKGIERLPDGLRIGAATTMSEIAESPLVRNDYLALAEGAGVVGSYQTMNMGTIGGNVCNAAPSADTAPAVLALEAEAIIADADGRRSVPIAEFFRGPGLTVLAPGELLTELRLSVPLHGTGSAYERHTPRKQMDIAVVGVGVVITLSGDRIERARVALGAVAPTPVRAPGAEAELEGQPANADTFARAAEVAATECSPITDIRASADFRRHLVKVMTARLLHRAAQRAGA